MKSFNNLIKFKTIKGAKIPKFIVYSLIDGQEKHIKNIDLLDISSSEDGEVRVSVRKVPKNDDYAIGFAEISEVVLIKQKIEEIRAKRQ